MRYRLHHKSGLLFLIYSVNGLIRNPDRMVQLEKICYAYDIIFIYPKPLIFSNGWLAFFDACGSLDYKFDGQKRPQLFITVTHKGYHNLVHFKELLGGFVRTDRTQNDRFTSYS